MKYYKLLKDLPTFKAGDLFYINPDQGCLVQKDTLILAYAKRTLEKFPNILTDWFEEIEESENKRWRAKYGKKYWYLCDYGIAFSNTECGNDIDDFRYIVGNYSKTEREAENYQEYLIARQVLLDDAEGGKFSDSYGAWYAIYSLIVKDYRTTYTFSCYFPGVIYFRTGKALKKSLKIHKEQWEIVRKYEMGEM